MLDNLRFQQIGIDLGLKSNVFLLILFNGILSIYNNNLCLLTRFAMNGTGLYHHISFFIFYF